LGIDHRFSGEGEPVVFETMVFGGKLDQECERYCTWEEAEKGHEAMIQRIRREANNKELNVKYRELIEEAKREIEEEAKRCAIDEIKERLEEIKETEICLAEMRTAYERLLDEQVE